MDTTVSRRKLLAATGVGLGLATAGCAGAGSERTVTAELQPPEDELEEAQQEARSLRQQQLTGNISRVEYQQQLSELQSELFDGLIDDATERAEGLGLTVEDSIEPTTMLVTGSESGLLDFLDTELVATLGDESQFEDAQSRQQQRQQQTTNETSEDSG